MKLVAVIYKLSLTVAVIYKPSLTVAVIYKLSLNVAVIYKPSLTCRHLHAAQSQISEVVYKSMFQATLLHLWPDGSIEKKEQKNIV